MLRVVVEEGGRPWMDILSKKTAKQIYKMESESGKNTREKNAQTVAPFPGRRGERLRVVLTWVINFFLFVICWVINNGGEEGSLL